MSEPVHAIVLAAGASSRLGQPKQLLERGGKPLVLDVVEKLLAAGIDRIVVVVGSSDARVRATLKSMDLDLVPNPRWSEGMGTSIAAGVANAVQSGAGAALIALTDQPRIDASHYRSLLDRYAATRSIVATGYPDGAGVPAIFPRTHFEELLRMEGDRGGQAILRRQGEAVEIVPNAGAADDLDVPADL